MDAIISYRHEEPGRFRQAGIAARRSGRYRRLPFSSSHDEQFWATPRSITSSTWNCSRQQPPTS